MKGYQTQQLQIIPKIDRYSNKVVQKEEDQKVPLVHPKPKANYQSYQKFRDAVSQLYTNND